MLSATRIRLYPNAVERDTLARQFGCVRFVRNRALAMKKAAWEERKENPLLLHDQEHAPAVEGH